VEFPEVTSEDKVWARPAHYAIAVLYFFIAAFLALRISSVEMVPTGDETHYLTVAHSLAFDGDLSLANNYLEKHYRAFYPGELAKRTSPSADRKRELPAQGLGLSLILAPVYKLAHSWAPTLLVPIIRLFICSITTIVLYQLLALAALAGCSFRSRVFILAATALSSPLLTYSNQIYPEIFAALLLVVAIKQMTEMEEHRWRVLLILAAIPGALLWLHPKYLAIAGGIALLSLTRFYKVFKIYKRSSSLFLPSVYGALTILGITSFFLFLHAQYGGWSPNRIYAGWDQEPLSLVELIRREGFQRVVIMLRMSAGFWIDQRFGLIPYAPIYAVFFPAAISLMKSGSRSILPILALFALHFAVLCWGAPLGGFSPPSRHMVVLIPLLLITIFLVFDHWTRYQKSLVAILAALGWIVAFLMFSNYRLIFSNLSWHNRDGISAFWSHFGMHEWIPNIAAVTLQWPLVLYWIAILILICFALLTRERRAVPDS
jgi:hypothetical protein